MSLPDPHPARPSQDALLRDPDFWRLWATGLVGYFVRWLEVVVFGIHAYEVTGSAFVVAAMTMLRLAPLALFGVFFGGVAARIPRRTGLIVSLWMLMLTTAALLVASATGRLTVGALALASVINGLAWTADNPLRRAMIGDLAGPARMGRAMALDVVASNACKLGGPALGGLMLAHLGMTGVLLPLLLLYVGALALVHGVRSGRTPGSAPAAGLRATIVDGWALVRNSPRLAAVLWITVLFNVFGWPVLSMVPVIGRDRLGLAADGVGLLASIDGLGTLVGALALAGVSRSHWYGPVFVVGIGLFLAMLPAFALSTSTLWTAAALFVSGIGQAGFSVMQATLVIVAAPPAQRSQALGLLTMCIGSGLFGFLGLGALADALGAPAAATLSALAGLALLAASWRLWRECWRSG